MAFSRVISQPIRQTQRSELPEYSAARLGALPRPTLRKSSLDPRVIRPIAVDAAVPTTARQEVSLEVTLDATNAGDASLVKEVSRHLDVDAVRQ
jgi:hypothetical protein